MRGEPTAGRPPRRPGNGSLRRDGLTPGRLEYRIWRCREDGGILEHRVALHAPLDLEAFRVEAQATDGEAEVTVRSLGRFDSLDAALRGLPELADVGPDSVDTAISVRSTRFGRVARELHGWADRIELNGREGELVGGGWFPREDHDQIATALADDAYPGGGRATFLLRCNDLFAVQIDGDTPDLLAAQTVEDAMADFLANHVEEWEEVRSRFLPDDEDDDQDDDDQDEDEADLDADDGAFGP